MRDNKPSAKLWIAPIDITTIKADAIVCAANTGLVLGCGVAGAIWRRGGAAIQHECDLLGKHKPGDVAVTGGGNLLVKHVLHAVSMGYQHPDVAALLKGVTRRCLEKATELGLESIVFPAIAAGRMKLPPEKSCRFMGEAIAEFDFSDSSLHTIGFALLDPDTYKLFLEKLPAIISTNTGISYSDKRPETVEMPWRT